MSKRTIFIGDIHGCYDELKLLIKKLELKDKDKVYFVGDYINKGPKSFKVLKFLYKNKEQFSGVLGNHDFYFLEKIKEKTKVKNCEEKLYKKLKEKTKILDFFKSFPLFIEEENFILVHAGVLNGIKLEDHTPEILTTIRENNGELWYKNYTGSKKIIYGHNALDGLQIREKTIGLDSGCVYGKSLTAYVLETGEIYSQNALDNYINVYK